MTHRPINLLLNFLRLDGYTVSRAPVSRGRVLLVFKIWGRDRNFKLWRIIPLASLRSGK